MGGKRRRWGGLAFKSLSGNMSITLTIHTNVGTDLLQSVSYSTNEGASWTTVNNADSTTVTVTSPVVKKGKRVCFKGIGSSYATSQQSSSFSGTNAYAVEGNIMSLLYGDQYEEQKTLSTQYCFRYLLGHGNLYSARELELPATTLSPYCYIFLLYNSNNLTEPPRILPATTLAEGCYARMFWGTKITESPILPATTLAPYCYESMFRQSSIITAPELPITTLAPQCYSSMFRDSALSVAPELPATTLETGCYSEMFYNCTNLQECPDLPATTLANTCYTDMFRGCTGIESSPVLAAAKPLIFSYQRMFQGCTNLKQITCLATDISSYGCLDSWVNGVSASGTFTKDASMTSFPSGANGIPSGWTVENYVEQN